MERIKSFARSFIGEEDGATMIEYALLIALIAIVVAVALVTLGNNIRDKYSSVATCVAGPTSNC